MTLTKKNKHYEYDLAKDEYTFFTAKKFGSDLVFTNSCINQIIKLYSKFSGNLTSTEIGNKLGISSKVIQHILRVMHITHDSLSFTDEYISSKPAEEVVSETLEFKKTKIVEKLEKVEFNKIKENAEKWELFEHNYKNVIDSFLQNWTPPKYFVPTLSKDQKESDQELIVGCSDWHYGLIADERYLYAQKEWNISATEKTVEDYSNQLVSHIKENSYKRITLAFLGDLIHGLDGLTDKGTKLEAHPIQEAQLETALNSSLKFIQNLLTVHNNVRVLAVPGNHSSFGDYFLLKMLSLIFQNDHRITFEITNKRFLTFNVGQNLFLLDHGYSAVTKSRLPAPGSGRENYINNLFMTKPEQMQNAKRLYYISADQHHMESSELTNVEHYMFSTLVGGCRYADNSGYKSRPRQSALVVKEQGVTQFLHFFFD
jgi:UDP-2,3-diacylglucosamine pyrophosphatase LpxH